MRKRRQTVILALLSTAAVQLSVHAQVCEYLWASVGPRELGEYAHCDAIGMDHKQNCVIAGHYRQSSRPRGGFQVFLAKLAPDGRVQVLRKEEGRGSVMCNSLTLDVEGNCYLTGQFWDFAVFGTHTLEDSGRHSDRRLPDVFVVKYDRSGRTLWAKKAGGVGQDTGTAIAVDSKGGCFVGGTYSGSAMFDDTRLSGSEGEFFLARYQRSEGALDWVRKCGGPKSGELTAMSVDPSGNCFLVGSFNETARFGRMTLRSRGRRDGFIVKCDSSGNMLWTRQVGGADGDYIKGVAVDRQGNCYVVGTFEGTIELESAQIESAGADDIFLAKYSSTGSLQWVQTAGGAGDEDVSDIAIDVSGELFIAGEFHYAAAFGDREVACAGGRDKFVAIYNSRGTLLWVCTSGQANEPCDFYHITVDGSGHCHLAGSFEHNADLGRLKLRNSGNQEMLIAKLQTWRTMKVNQTLDFSRINARVASLLAQVLDKAENRECVKKLQIEVLQKDSDRQLNRLKIRALCEITKCKSFKLDPPIKFHGELIHAKKGSRTGRRGDWSTRTRLTCRADFSLANAIKGYSQLHGSDSEGVGQSALEQAYDTILEEVARMARQGASAKDLLTLYYSKLKKLEPRILKRQQELDARVKEINRAGSLALTEYMALDREYRSVGNMKLMCENLTISKDGRTLTLAMADCPASFSILGGDVGLEKADSLRIEISARRITVDILVTADVPIERQASYNRVRDKVIATLVAFQNGDNDDAFKGGIGQFFGFLAD